MERPAPTVRWAEMERPDRAAYPALKEMEVKTCKPEVLEEQEQVETTVEMGSRAVCIKEVPILVPAPVVYRQDAVAPEVQPAVGRNVLLAVFSGHPLVVQSPPGNPGNLAATVDRAFKVRRD